MGLGRCGQQRGYGLRVDGQGGCNDVAAEVLDICWKASGVQMPVQDSTEDGSQSIIRDLHIDSTWSL